MRSFLKWAGGKYAIREHILAALPEGKRLIEPFVGSGVIFLNTHYSHYLLGEKNADLIELYQFLQKEGQTFIDDCRHYFQPENNCAEKYAAFRNQFNETLHQSKRKKERALLFLYLNRHGYNGLCRYNNQGYYNVPFGRYENPRFPEKNMHYFHEKSQNAVFQYADFRDTLKQAKKGDVIYCDPPYFPIKKAHQYISTEFSEQDQKDLAQYAEKLSKKAISIILSNHDTPETREYYKKANLTSLEVRRYISCDIKNREKASEIIAIF